MKKMRNKISGDVYGDVKITPIADGTMNCWKVEFDGQVKYYDHFNEIAEEWEDGEESFYYYFIQDDGRIGCDAVDPYNHKSKVEECKSIGNHFETREEAEKAVERLRAWKRLKDKGFRFSNWNCSLEEIYFKTPDTFFDRPDMLGEAISEETSKDLDLLFGGEE